MNLKELLKKDLTEEELKMCPHSYETVGDISIIEIPPELSHKENMIGSKLLRSRKNIRLVVKKGGEREGDFRIKKYIKIAGSGSTETTHKENYCTFHLDIDKVYFSSKESTERERIADLIEDEESVLVMGCGIGTFPIVMAKKKSVDVVGIDINPDAIRFFEDNLKSNKLKGKVSAMLSDARTFSEKYNGKFDRVLITIPHKPEEFIEEAIDCLKSRGMLHLYMIEGGNGVEKDVSEIESRLSGLGVRYKVTGASKVLPYSPRIHKLRIDVNIY